jgi:glyoxylase-like metal-dependent hydrolase (beta-lactamase superfamily II)
LVEVKKFVASNGVRVFQISCDVSPDMAGRVYLLLGAGPPTLVDAGSGEGASTPQILAALKAVSTEFGESFQPTDLRRILITHAHFDHVGGIADLVDLTGAEVAVHPMDSRIVSAWDERAVLYNRGLAAFLRRSGIREEQLPEMIRVFGFCPGRVRSVPVTTHLTDGMELDGMRFLHTPGHSPGHVCIVVGDILLCGDHILARTVSQQWPECVVAYTGLGHYLEAIDKVSQVEGIRLGLGGHEPAILDLPARIAEIRASHDRRLNRLLGIMANASEPMTIEEMTYVMYSHQKGFHALLAITDVGSRIEYLDQRGQLTIANLDEVMRDGTTPCRFRPA